MPRPDLTQLATQYTLSLLPLDHVDANSFWITVEWRGGDRWAVKHLTKCLDRSGQWDHEPPPSSRSESWLANHRFDLDEALRLARAQIPHIRINGYGVTEILAMDETRQTKAGTDATT